MTSGSSSAGASAAGSGSFAAARSRRERLRLLSAVEIALGGAAALVLPLMALALRRYGLRRVQSRLQRTFKVGSSAHPEGADLEAARRTAWVVDVAAKRGLWRANCLQRSVTLWWFLGRRGITSELRIGVRRRRSQDGTNSGNLDFHAWVERDGIVLNDVADIRERFATFDRAVAPPDASWRR